MIRLRVMTGEIASDEDVNKFADIVASGGAVNEKFVRRGLSRQGAQLIFAEFDGKHVGVAARKVPDAGYRNKFVLKEKAGFALPLNLFRYELGYVSVVRQYRQRGIGRQLVEGVLEQAGDEGLFATTSSVAMKSMLLSVGFEQVGRRWKSNSGGMLELFIKKAL